MATPLPPHDAPTLPAPPVDAAPLPRRQRATPPWRQIAHSLGWRQATPGIVDLRHARDAFIACLDDLPSIDCRALRHLLGHAQSLTELWHLRPEVYRTLALHHSQAEAEYRVGALAGLFGTPARATRVASPHSA